MSVVEVVNDLLTLDDVGRHLDDRERRRLDEVRCRIARRHRGAKVSEAAAILGIDQPTIRTWIDEGVLPAIPDAGPVRVDVLAVADLKRAVDLVRASTDRGELLLHVSRVLPDREALDGADVGFDDYRAGRVVPVDDLGIERHSS